MDMELQSSKQRFDNQNFHKKHVTGIPISSAEKCAFSIKSPSKALLQDPAVQYQLLPSPSTDYSKIRNNGEDSVISKMIKIAESMDVFAQRIRKHVKRKLSIGARMLQGGGVEKVSKKNFNISDDEKLLKASQCYLSTTAGPMAGMLFVSSDTVAFCSHRSIKCSSTTGKLLKLRYKVMIPLRKIKRVNESENMTKPKQKYVQLVTEDDFEFWFMGFLNHEKALKYIEMAIHEAK